ncbi:hypothetical protein EYF80_002367 [Liparis tanakae]|uniref:Uncharacterized protein n=1 Tax=Liparis tanakae TaxID=230148 RepID=A0A4Z2J9Z8_9TELE|nr:hypothetical protein EYF80_002367 [Liparis tanakae]
MKGALQHQLSIGVGATVEVFVLAGWASALRLGGSCVTGCCSCEIVRSPGSVCQKASPYSSSTPSHGVARHPAQPETR